jgi:glucose-6-phosphate 1-dehydrogenase
MPLHSGSNRLTIRLQPNESVRLNALGKISRMGMKLRGVYLDLAYHQFFQQKRMEAYQRLLLDVIAGRLALFVLRDEQEAAWRWVAPILDEWSRSDVVPKPYAGGTWGPTAASALLAREGTCWLEEES